MLLMNINLSDVNMRHVPPTSHVLSCAFALCEVCEESGFRALTGQIYFPKWKVSMCLFFTLAIESVYFPYTFKMLDKHF